MFGMPTSQFIEMCQAKIDEKYPEYPQNFFVFPKEEVHPMQSIREKTSAIKQKIKNAPKKATRAVFKKPLADDETPLLAKSDEEETDGTDNTELY